MEFRYECSFGYRRLLTSNKPFGLYINNLPFNKPARTTLPQGELSMTE